MRSILKSSKKIVIKVGTSILSTSSGRISQLNLQRIGNQVVQLTKLKKQVVLVSSGAIAFGMQKAGLKKRPSNMTKLQACAAIGQNCLMDAYQEFFSKKKMDTAQLLLTRDGLEMRKRFLSARHTLDELLKMKVLPIVNENDTVATEEIAFGDNDQLSVQVAHLMDADLLVLLSDVDGFYLKDGSRIREVSSVSDIDNRLTSHLKDYKKERTVGGMRAKLQAAKMAMNMGIPLLILDGTKTDEIQRCMAGEDTGTLFYEHGAKKNARKKWIAYSAARKGRLILDSGATHALIEKKRSLLASGIVKISGTFDRGDIVELASNDDRVFGRGIVRYRSRELSKVLGKKTQDIRKVLGSKISDEVIHRNDMVIWA